MTRSVSDLADRLMQDVAGLQRRADTLLETIETMMPNRIAAGAAAQSTLIDLAAAAGLAKTSARALDGVHLRLQLLGTVIAALSVALENGGGEDDAALAEHARQLRLLLLDCASSQPN